MYGCFRRKGFADVKRTFIDDTVKTFDSACDIFTRYKKSNPLCTHKSFRMEDEYYRKNKPEDGVLKVEFGVDGESYVIVTAAVVLGVLVVCKAVSMARRARERSQMKAQMRRRCRHKASASAV